MGLMQCKDCRFYDENWCYEKNFEVDPNAMSCPEIVYEKDKNGKNKAERN